MNPAPHPLRLQAALSPLRLWLLACIALAVLASMAALLIHRHDHAQTRLLAEEVAHTQADAWQRMLDDASRRLDDFARLSPGNEDGLALDEHSAIRALLLLDAGGAVQRRTGRAESIARIAPTQLAELALAARQAVVIGTPQAETGSGEHVFALARQLRDGRVGVALLATEGLSRAVTARFAGNHLGVALVHRDGTLMLRAPSAGSVPGSALDQSLQARLEQIRSGGLEYARTSDQSRRLGHLLALEDYPLLVLGSADLDAGLTSWKVFLTFAGAVWLAFSAGSYVVVRRLEAQHRREQDALAMYDELFEHAADAIFVVAAEADGQSFRYVSANRSLAESTGLPLQQLVGSRPQDVLPADVAEMVSRHYAECFESGRIVRFSHEFVLPGGTRTWRMVLTPIRRPGGGPIERIIGIGRDVTEERTLNERLAGITANLPGFVYQLMYDPADQRFTYVYAGDSLNEFIGLSPQDVLADADLLLGRIHPDDVDEVIASSLAHAEQGKPWRAVFRVQHSDGRMIWVEARDVPRRLPDGRTLWTGYANDITALKQLEEALAQREEIFRNFVENANDIIYSVSPEGMLTYVSPNWRELLGQDPAKALGSNIADYVHPDDLPACMQFLHEVVTNGQKRQGIEYRVRHANGEWRWHTSNASPHFDAEGRIDGLNGIARDVTDRHRAEEEIRHMAHHDTLTGLPNRALFSEMLEQACRVANRHPDQRLALMFVDLDRFKPVNDEHGHAVGDLLLAEVAGRITAALRDADIAARIGGDEFVVMLHQVNSETDALLVAEKVRAALDQPFMISELSLDISSSIGLALYPDDAATPQELMLHADQAMYAAKNAGRNTVRRYTRTDSSALPA